MDWTHWRSYLEQCEHEQIGHTRYAEFCGTVDAALQLPGIICTGLNVLSSSAGWSTVTIVLSCIAACTHGIANLLNFRQRQVAHEEQAAKFASLARFLRAEQLLNQGRTSDFYPYEPLHAHGDQIKPDQVLVLKTEEQYAHYINSYIVDALDFIELDVPRWCYTRPMPHLE